MLPVPAPLKVPFVFSTSLESSASDFALFVSDIMVDILIDEGVDAKKARKKIPAIECEEIAWPAGSPLTHIVCFVEGKRPTDEEILFLLFKKHLSTSNPFNASKAAADFFRKFYWHDMDSEQDVLSVGNIRLSQEETKLKILGWRAGIERESIDPANPVCHAVDAESSAVVRM